MGLFEAHLEDYLACKDIISSRVQLGLKDHPVRFAHLMARALEESESYDHFASQVDDKTNLPMRKAHDFYGWMSKNESRGVCRGTLYRSQRYMEIPLEERSGKKEDRRNSFAVHIEHTIPINQIVRSLWEQRAELLEIEKVKNLPRLMHERFLALSVCTALTREEEENCIRSGFKSRHPAFDRDVPLSSETLTLVRPFERYDFSGDLSLFEITSGSKINPLTWTLGDHLKLISGIDIYQWDYLDQENTQVRRS